MTRISEECVRQALINLYSPAELATSDLARLLPQAAEAEDEVQRAQAVRGVLLDAIEMLRLPAGGSRSASASRAYDCVRLRYVSGFDVDSVARQLAVGRRQVYRDLQWAEERLAELLETGDFFTELAAAPPQSDGEDAVAAEIRSLTQKAESIEMTEALRAAVGLVSAMAQAKGIGVAVHAPEAPIVAFATAAILRQVVTLVLSAVIQSEPPEDVVVELSSHGRYALVSLPLLPEPQLARPDLIQVALELAETQRWPCEVQGEPQRRLLLSLPLAKRRRVLIVEDNPGTQALYGRYLAESEWEVVTVPNPRLTVDLAAAKQVDAVILDIMMSESDGWTLLQHLKLSPKTEAIPVIVCSVLNDPDLGMALGASAYLLKPVSRMDLLRTLRQVAPAAMSEADSPEPTG
jgi:CheY-like chemotaxis protein